MDAGVAVFFVISGFLLYRPFVAARMEGRPRPSVPRFFRRRALRILPAYWVALTVLSLSFPRAVPGVWDHDPWVYYALIQNWKDYWIVVGLGVAWSLCVEVSYYAILPAYALAAGRWLRGMPPARQARIELWALGAIALASVVARTVMHSARPHAPFSHMLPGLLLWFAGGMAMAVLSCRWAGRPVAELPRLLRVVTLRPWTSWAAALAVMLFAAYGAGLPLTLYVQFTDTSWLVEHLLYGAIGVLVVAPAVFGARGIVAVALGNPLVKWLGLISYGIFLYHLPFTGNLDFVNQRFGFVAFALAVAAAAIGCATLSYYLVERPFLRLKEPRGRRRRSGYAGGEATAGTASP
jgi:peptidoglycan/LPS O-acetylase OafA/YrhL